MNLFLLLRITTVTLMLSPQVSYADWQWTKWGMSPQQVANDSAGRATTIEGRKTEKMQNLAKGTYTTNGIEFESIFWFTLSEPRLMLIELIAQSPTFSKCNELRTSLHDVYGKPDDRGGIPLIKLSTYRWRDPSMGNRILLAVSESPDRCSIQYTELVTRSGLGL